MGNYTALRYLLRCSQARRLYDEEVRDIRLVLERLEVLEKVYKDAERLVKAFIGSNPDLFYAEIEALTWAAFPKVVRA